MSQVRNTSLSDYRTRLCGNFRSVQYQPLQIIGKNSDCKFINILIDDK